MFRLILSGGDRRRYLTLAAGSVRLLTFRVW